MRPKTTKRSDGRHQCYYLCPHHYTAEQGTAIALSNWKLSTGKNGKPVSNAHLRGQISCKKYKHIVYPANKSDSAYEKAVAKHLAKHERKLYEEKQARPSASKTIAEINEKYKTYCKKLQGSEGFSKSMNEIRERVSRRYIITELGDKAVGQISEKDLILFFDNLHLFFIDEELGDTLFLHVQVVLNSIFDFAYIHNYIKDNPVTAKVSNTANKNRKKIKDTYVSNRVRWDSKTVDLVTNFVYFLIDKSESNPEYKTLSEYMMLTLHIGTRASETAGIQLGDFDIDNDKIHIQRQTVKISGTKYNGLDSVVENVRLKTKNANRKIPISTDVKNLFLKIDAEYEEGVRQPDIFGNKSLWQDDEGVPLTTTVFRAMLQKFLRNFGEEFKNKFGEAYGFQFHALRHACISTWLMNGVNPNTVKFWAGHSTFQMTSDTYGHLIDSREEKFNMSEVLERGDIQ